MRKLIKKARGFEIYALDPYSRSEKTLITLLFLTWLSSQMTVKTHLGCEAISGGICFIRAKVPHGLFSISYSVWGLSKLSVLVQHKITYSLQALHSGLIAERASFLLVCNVLWITALVTTVVQSLQLLLIQSVTAVNCNLSAAMNASTMKHWWNV